MYSTHKQAHDIHSSSHSEKCNLHNSLGNYDLLSYIHPMLYTDLSHRKCLSSNTKSWFSLHNQIKLKPNILHLSKSLYSRNWHKASKMEFRFSYTFSTRAENKEHVPHLPNLLTIQPPCNSGQKCHQTEHFRISKPQNCLARMLL